MIYAVTSEKFQDYLKEAVKFEKKYLEKQAKREIHPKIIQYLCSGAGLRLMNIDGAIAAKVVKHFTDKDEPILCVHDSFICREQFKEELVQVMNEKTSETLAGYVVGIKSNKEVLDLSPFSHEGIFNVTELKDIYLNRSNREYRCEGYTSRWSEHKYWLHTLENPIYANY